MATAFGHVVRVAGLACGIAAWLVLILGFAFSYLFVQSVRRDPRAVLSPRTGTQLFVIASASLLSGAGCLLAALAFIEPPSRWTWIALGANAFLPIIVFGSLYFSVLRKR